jgi:hypothetical protein
MKTISGNLLHPRQPIFWLLRYRPAQASPLRSETCAGLPLQIQKIGVPFHSEVDTSTTHI